MKHFHTGVIFSLIFALMAAPAGAQPGFELPEPANGRAVVSLGKAKDPKTGKIVEGIAFIHYKKGNAKPDNPGNGNGKGNGGGDDTSSCYAYIAKGAKWGSIEDWVMNPANTRGLDENSLFNNQVANYAKWEDAANADIIGDGVQTNAALVADTQAPDDVNEIYFGSIDEPGVIAVTTVWGIFYGNPANREIVEQDMVFDQDDFDWSLTGEAGKMDFENIATHEDGHGLGMGHPDGSCTQETMYAYADFGETIKRDLNAGDIAGIDALY